MIFVSLLFATSAFANQCPVFQGNYKCDIGIEQKMETRTGEKGETIYTFNESELVVDGNQHTTIEDGLAIDYSAYCADGKVKISSVIILGKSQNVQSSIGTFELVKSQFVHRAHTKMFTSQGKFLGEASQKTVCDPVK